MGFMKDVLTHFPERFEPKGKRVRFDVIFFPSQDIFVVFGIIKKVEKRF